MFLIETPREKCLNMGVGLNSPRNICSFLAINLVVNVSYDSEVMKIPW